MTCIRGPSGLRRRGRLLECSVGGTVSGCTGGLRARKGEDTSARTIVCHQALRCGFTASLRHCASGKRTSGNMLREAAARCKVTAAADSSVTWKPTAGLALWRRFSRALCCLACLSQQLVEFCGILSRLHSSVDCRSAQLRVTEVSGSLHGYGRFAGSWCCMSHRLCASGVAQENFGCASRKVGR
jgi:hypothetical protein